MKYNTLTLDASQMTSHLKCPLMRTYQYDEGLTIIGANDRSMNMGTIMHSLLDMYYRERVKEPGENYTKQVKKVNDEYIKNGEWEKLISIEDLEFVLERFLYYCVNYTGGGNDFSVVNTPSGGAGVELGFSKELGRVKISNKLTLVFIVEGRIDLLVNIQSLGGVLAFADHKTQSRENTLYKNTPQFLTYAWAAEVQYGVVNYIRFQQTGNPEKWFRRQILNFSPYEIREWEKQMWNIFYKIAGGGQYDKNLGACSGAFQSTPCQYVKLCETGSPELRSNIMANNYIKSETKWRPW